MSPIEVTPDFPDDVPVAKLHNVSLAKLEKGTKSELANLFDACRDSGFFELDLSESSLGEKVLDLSEEVYSIGRETFGMTVEEKEKYKFDPPAGKINGWKPHGAGQVGKTGKREGNEMWNIAQDEIISVTPRGPNAPSVERGWSSLEDFMRASHSIVQTLFRALEPSLDLPQGTLASYHRLEESTMAALRLIKYAPHKDGDHEFSMVPHTDLGSMTLLFTKLGGLQILPPQTSTMNPHKWLYVKPMENCICVNVGDTLTMFTNGILRSNLHRVLEPPGEQARCTRYSIGYMCRVEKDVKMGKLKLGSVIPQDDSEDQFEGLPAEEWTNRKAIAILHGETIPVSKGGKEYVPVDS